MSDWDQGNTDSNSPIVTLQSTQSTLQVHGLEEHYVECLDYLKEVCDTRAIYSLKFTPLNKDECRNVCVEHNLICFCQLWFAGYGRKTRCATRGRISNKNQIWILCTYVLPLFYTYTHISQSKCKKLCNFMAFWMSWYHHLSSFKPTVSHWS